MSQVTSDTFTSHQLQCCKSFGALVTSHLARGFSLPAQDVAHGVPVVRLSPTADESSFPKLLTKECVKKGNCSVFVLKQM